LAQLELSGEPEVMSSGMFVLDQNHCETASCEIR
jgi:hypothetical protein